MTCVGISFDRVAGLGTAGIKIAWQRSVDGAKQQPTSAFLSEQPSLAIAFQQRNRTLPSQPHNAWSPLHSIFSWKAGMRSCFAFTVSAGRKFEDGELKQDAA
jgi:hypothetical protein